MSTSPLDVDLARPTSWMQPASVRETDGTETPLPRFDRHLLCADDGLFPGAFNTWETEVLRAELARAGTVAWYRNPSRASQDSVGIVYEEDGEPKIVRPDFVFFGLLGDGAIVADIVDPHGTQFSDAGPKLKGLARYAAVHAGVFRRIEAVARIGDAFRVLDLTERDVRAAVASARFNQGAVRERSRLGLLPITFAPRGRADSPRLAFGTRRPGSLDVVPDSPLPVARVGYTARPANTTTPWAIVSLPACSVHSGHPSFRAHRIRRPLPSTSSASRLPPRHRPHPRPRTVLAPPARPGRRTGSLRPGTAAPCWGPPSAAGTRRDRAARLNSRRRPAAFERWRTSRFRRSPNGVCPYGWTVPTACFDRVTLCCSSNCTGLIVTIRQTQQGVSSDSADPAESETQREVNAGLRGQCLVPGDFPVPMQEFAHPREPQVGDAGEDIGKPGLRVDVVELGGDDEGVHRRGALAAAVGAGEQATSVFPVRSRRRARRIALIVDNAIVHKSSITQRWLANNPKFELLFQPVYHPWVKVIERLWKTLHDTVTRNHRHRFMNALMGSVRHDVTSASSGRASDSAWWPGRSLCDATPRPMLVPR